MAMKPPPSSPAPLNSLRARAHPGGAHPEGGGPPQEIASLFGAIVASSSDGILVVDRTGKVLHANQRFEKMWRIPETLLQSGLDPALLDHMLSQLKHPQDFLAKVISLYHMGEKDRDTLHLTDGRVYERNSFPLFEDNALFGRVWVFRDISDRKRAETALAESENKFRQLYAECKKTEQRYLSLLNSSADAIVIYDMAGHPVFINPAFTRRFGWTLEELDGSCVPYVPDKEKVATQFLISDLVKNGTACHGFETRRLTKDGGTIDVSISASRFDDHRGEPAGLLVCLRDISQRKQLEKKLRRVERLEAIGTLAGGIAHDFNNLMMGIGGNVSLMLYQIDPTHDHYEKLQRIQKLIESGARMTRQLLGYARKGHYDIKPLCLNAIIENYCETLERTRKQVSIHLDLDPHLCSIQADEAQVEQVLLNLFINAADAMPDGGPLMLRTTTVTHDQMIGKPYRPRRGRYVLLEVKDRGVGMEPEVAKRVFEPFFTTKEMGRGTGLGLASAYGIVKGHGGYIDVDSIKGQGSTFSVYLPACQEPCRQSKTNTSPLIAGNGTVLLVDDEEAVMEVTRNMLKRFGYRVITAKDGAEAIAAFEKHHRTVDLVILDMIMPDMGGGKVFDALRRVDPDVAVLLSSGYSLNPQAEAILRRGCRGFIEKPFTLRDLSRKLSEILP